jgi:dihydropteroate synthase
MATTRKRSSSAIRSGDQAPSSGSVRAASPAAPPCLYLEPLDLQWGPAARRARRWFGALPVCGERAAATGVAVWRPGRDDPVQSLPAGEVPDWIAGLPVAERQRALGIVANWRLSRRFPGLHGAAPALMGVVNVTRDSFYPDSRMPTLAAAMAQAARAVAEGAAILDIGGQSSRPGSQPVSLAHELAAVLPAVRQAQGFGVPVSADTLRPAVARAAAAAGAAIVNDISGLMLPAAAAGAALIVGDMRGNPATMQQWPRSRFGVFDTYARLEARVAACLAAGLPRERIAADPGFGFGKTVWHNQALIQHLPLFLGLGVAIVVGVSRKGSLGFLSGTRRAEDRLPASLAAAEAAVRGGASILRVHDVAATRQMLQVLRTFC